MTYREAIDFLHGLRIFGTKPGLENTFRLAEGVGNPQKQLRFIHVAGTNGKGSTCAMLESIYRGAGLTVGLYTSPHLVSFRERIQVNRISIPEDKVAEFVELLQPMIEALGENKATFFEVVTIMALKHFATEACDLVIWETGLGGRLDATNIVTPLASVITNIQFDHVQWLGETLQQIATEKAGIIKQGIPVVTATDSPEALGVIRETARAKEARLVEVSAADAVSLNNLSLKGAHQRINAALALATVKVLNDQIPVPENIAERALSEVQWPGRFQILRRSVNSTVILDGAHNPAGIQALVETMNRQFPNAKFTVIIGMLRDKSWPESVSLLLPLTCRVLPVPVKSDRTVAAEELAQFCKSSVGDRLEIVPCSDLSSALALTGSDSLTVITGSLYLVGEAMQLLGVSPASDDREAKLNEWSQAGAPPIRSAQ